MDKLYAGLKDLAEERRGKLQERLRLTQLKREVDDLEQWIAEREVVAGSHELGQDYEHVTVRITSLSLLSTRSEISETVVFKGHFIKNIKSWKVPAKDASYTLSQLMVQKMMVSVTVLEKVCHDVY